MKGIEGLREQFTGRFSDFSFHLFLINFWWGPVDWLVDGHFSGLIYLVTFLERARALNRLKV